MPLENADGEMMRMYLQRLCNGDPQKLAALAGMNHEATTDDLQEPAEMSLTDASIEGAEQPGPGTDQDADPLPVKEAAVVPVDVSTPEEVATGGTPAVEEPQMAVKPPKVPRLVAPYKYAAAQQCHSLLHIYCIFLGIPTQVHFLQAAQSEGRAASFAWVREQTRQPDSSCRRK